MTVIYKTLAEAMSEVQKAIASNKFVSVRPAWIYNPDFTDFDKQYVVDEDYITVRGVDEIIGSKSLDELKEEIIEIQRESHFQSQVVSELNKRYNASPEEINLMLFRTGTQVPRRFKSLSEYKESGEWIGDKKETESKGWHPTQMNKPSVTDYFGMGDSSLFDLGNKPAEKTTKSKKNNKK